MKVGFIGLGQMGAGIAANLITAGHEVTVYNRSIEKTEPLVARGARAAKRRRRCVPRRGGDDDAG